MRSWELCGVPLQPTSQQTHKRTRARERAHTSQVLADLGAAGPLAAVLLDDVRAAAARRRAAAVLMFVFSTRPPYFFMFFLHTTAEPFITRST